MANDKDNGNINPKKLKHSLREYIWESIILRKIFSNPFIVSIFILIIIWLLDIMYGKNFACADRKEIIQHILTTYIVVAIGIVLNNLTLKNKYKKDCTPATIGANDSQTYDHPAQHGASVHPAQYGASVHHDRPATNEYPGMNQIISEYTE